MPAPPRRPLDLRTFDQLTADIDRLRVNGYEKTGDWTLEQVLDHLIKRRSPAWAAAACRGPCGGCCGRS